MIVDERHEAERIALEVRRAHIEAAVIEIPSEHEGADLDP